MDIVKVTCYGRTETLTRNEALRKYSEAILGSDGSERDRYAQIVAELVDGWSTVSDEF